MPSLPRDRLGRPAAVAGQHDDPQPVGVQQANRLGGRSLDRGRRRRPGPPARPSTATSITVWPSSRSASSRRLHGADVDRQVGHQRGIAQGDGWPSTVPVTPLPGHRPKVAGLGQGQALVRSAALTIAAASGCSLPRSRLAASRKNVVGRQIRPPARVPPERGFPFGQRAGLVHDERVGPVQNFQRLGVLEQDPRFGPPPRADHDRHRRRQPQRARAGDDQHGDGVHERMGQPRLGSPETPDDKRHETDQRRRRHEKPRHPIDEALDRRPAALGLADHADDFRQQRVGADSLGPDQQAHRCR